MSSIKISLDIDIKDFPLLADIKKGKINEIINKLLKTGYDIHYPSLEVISKQTDQSIIIEKINQFTNKIESSQENVQNIVNKLIGISSNSSKKGNFAENMLEEYISSRYGDITFERKSSQAHSGDAWLRFGNNNIIMLESKNYTTTVNKDEINKLKSDMITHHIRWSVMVSFNSSIQGMKEFDFHTFNHNNETYYIIMISNLANDLSRLDVAIQIAKKIMDKFNSPINFPWIIEDITKTIHELNEISKHNYMLRDAYYNMEKEMNNQLNNFYIKLREYQTDIDMKINELVNKLQATMNKSIETPRNKYDIITQYIDNDKVLSLLTRIIDVFDNKNWEIVKNDNTWNILNNNDIIGSIKIQTKKIVLCLDYINNSINFDIDKHKQFKKSINMLKSI
jgi:hypothetical protein